MANLKSEQLKKDFSLEINYDEPLSLSEIVKNVKNILGKENCFTQKICNKNLLCYEHQNKKEILLLASITYLGGNGQHPIYKKRMQLKKWYKDIVNYYQNDLKFNVRFIGVYHYQKNIIFTEFLKDTYIKKKMNSSAAHVYTNDLYQAMKEGLFKRIDKNQNIIITIQDTKFKEYLDGKFSSDKHNLYQIFKEFNINLNFGKWILARDAIIQMHEAGWNKWKETEWPGWYLEFKLNEFIKQKGLENQILYVGSHHKKKGDFDFDLWFNEENFYGDLKASNILKKETPGNDQQHFIECINKHDKFWYIIYEHETIKDSAQNNYDATRFRTCYIKECNEWPKNKPWDELSYCKRMKHSVKFVKMSIIELNKVNFRETLNDFNQGRQPNGDARKPKFKITKNNIENFIVFQQNFLEIENKDC